MTRNEAGVVLSDRAVTANRLGSGTGRGGFIALVGQLVDAIDRQDRWAVARRATGRLLDELLSGQYGEYFGVPTTSAECLGLDNAPVVLVDDGLAIVTAPVMRRHVGVVGAVSALLVQAEGRDGPWLVASLTQNTLLDSAFRGRVQHEAFEIDADLEIIAAHGPLDARASSIDWVDGSVILRQSDTGVTTVADARAEAATWPRESWHWLADDGLTFAGLYLRRCHPELVREFPHRRAGGRRHD
ncbi:hypothetical protein BH93_19510 [Rhodococcoides fascians A25f]|uniref:hypothetical protein n=1 Tax=Rhodococcoides fascians TaxID=1828 RepID=UPI00068D2531|nr:hypothetical protein [Rhodococcus fascians]QII07259.1 hypothetical protein BH93_19510 [Rhodococcus fascians A25f]